MNDQNFVIKNDFSVPGFAILPEFNLIFIFPDIEVCTALKEEEMFSIFKYCAIDYLYEVGCY